MHKLKNKRVIIFLMIFCTIFSMTVICASFATDMFITGDAYVRAPRSIRVKSVQIINPINGGSASTPVKFSAQRVNINATLPQLDSTVTYRVTIQNNSNDIYILSSITSDLSNESITTNALNYDKQIISANQTVTLDITLSYNTETLPEVTSQSGVLTFEFTIPVAANIAYSSDYTAEDNVQDALDELYDLLSDDE